MSESTRWRVVEPGSVLNGAARQFKAKLRWLLLAAILAAGVSIALDVRRRVSGVDATALSNTLAALALVLAAGALMLSVHDRRRREVPRRRTGWLLLGIAFGIVFVGQAVGYLLIIPANRGFDARVEGVPLLIAAPLLGMGLFLLSWPPAMSTAERWSVVADGVVAATALTAIWATMVVPWYRSAEMSDAAPWAAIDAWMTWAVVLYLVVLGSASRRSGALPLPQVQLLQTSALIYAISDILGHLLPWADNQSNVSYSILGYVIAAWLTCLAAFRPAVEPENAGTQLGRERWASVAPLVPVALMVVVIVGYRLIVGPLSGWALGLASLAMVVIVVVNALERGLVHHQAFRLSDALLADGLQQGVRQEWFSALVGGTRDLVTVVDSRGRILYQTPSVQTAFGFPLDQLTGSHFSALTVGCDELTLASWLQRAALDEDGRGPYDLVIVDAQGRDHDTETTIAPMSVGGADAFVLTTRDVTDRRRLNEELTASSLRDPLTGLANREGFLGHLATLRETAAAPLSVVLIDLYGFRDLNDGHGHQRGDEALRCVADRLNRLPADVHAVARIGGDEFGIAVATLEADRDVGELRQNLIDDLRGLPLSDGAAVDIGFSLGYAVADPDEVDGAVELLERADLALSAARGGGPLGVMRFDPAMREALTERLHAERSLREALRHDRIVVHYQPVVNLADGHIVGVEALVRMVDPDGVFVSPAQFIPMAESLGLIHSLGNVVLVQSLRDQPRLVEALGREMTVAVNVSALQLDPNLHPTVRDALDQTQTDPRQITLELTETALAENQKSASSYLAQLRAMGCRVALDDFGTGFSSLSYLASMPVDIIKVDRSFITDLGHKPTSESLVRAVVQLARSLGLTTVAEGVETTEQAHMLRLLGAERAQGFLYCRPLPLDDLCDRIRANGGDFTPRNG